MGRDLHLEIPRLPFRAVWGNMHRASVDACYLLAREEGVFRVVVVRCLAFARTGGLLDACDGPAVEEEDEPYFWADNVLLSSDLTRDFFAGEEDGSVRGGRMEVDGEVWRGFCFVWTDHNKM